MTPGHDPARLARIAPTELAPGEDPVERFVREAEAVQTVVHHTAPGAVGEAVRGALARAGARRVALAADLGDDRAAVRAALAAAGVRADDYEAVAGERDRIRDLDATVTGCVAAVAATGSIVTGGAAGRAGALVAPVHVCVVRREQMHDGLLSLLRALPGLDAGSAVALQSGPSRTADIEKTLILGMHVPREVHVILVR